MDLKKYDNYKNSGIEWIGEIPNHWEIKRLKNIGKLYSGLSGKSGSDFEKTPTENYKPFINFTNIANNKYIVNDNFGYVKIDEHENQNKVKKNDLFFLMSSENHEDVGKSALLLEDYDELYLNSFCKGFRLNNNLDARFINYLLTSSALSQLISLEGRGFTRINLRMEGVENLPLILPQSTDEQTTIANYLDQKTTEIDNLITKKERLIQLLEEERTAFINQALSKGLDPNVPLKDSGIEWLGEIPKHWEVKKLRFIGNCQNGISAGSEYFGTGFPFVSYRDVYKNEILPFSVIGLAQSNEKEQMHYSVEEGDVFFTRTSETVEEIGISSVCFQKIEEAVFAGFLIRFRPNKEMINKEFSKYYFRCFIPRTFFVKEMNLVTRASLSQELLKRLPVLLPSINEQKSIADFLDIKTSEIDTLISKTKQEIELLKEYKTALISEVVTGKVDVRNEILN